MKIGLDWDGTVSADPITFGTVVRSFLDAGHDVSVVTWRTPPDAASGWGSSGRWEDMELVFENWGFRIPVVYCNGRAKRECFRADVWIDDNPAAVVFSLMSEPRFAEDANDYNKDRLVCEWPGYDPVHVNWEQVKGVHEVPPIPKETLNGSV